MRSKIYFQVFLAQYFMESVTSPIFPTWLLDRVNHILALVPVVKHNKDNFAFGGERENSGCSAGKGKSTKRCTIIKKREADSCAFAPSPPPLPPHLCSALTLTPKKVFLLFFQMLDLLMRGFDHKLWYKCGYMATMKGCGCTVCCVNCQLLTYLLCVSKFVCSMTTLYIFLFVLLLF